MPRLRNLLFLLATVSVPFCGCENSSGTGNPTAAPDVKMLRIIRNRCVEYAFGYGDSIGFRGCRQYRSPVREFSLSDHRALNTKEFIDLMGDWGAYDSLEVFHPFQETLMVENDSKEWGRHFTVESGPIIALEFILAQNFSNEDSLVAEYHDGRGADYTLRRGRDFFPSGSETFFRVPMTSVGNGVDEDKNGYVDDFSELEYFGYNSSLVANQVVSVHQTATPAQVFHLAVGVNLSHSLMNPLLHYFWPNGDSTDIASYYPLFMHYHPDSGWSYRYKPSLRGGKQGILVAATLYMGPYVKFTEKICVKLFTVDRTSGEVVLHKPLIYRFDPARYPFGALQPPADPFNGDMLPREIYLVGKKSMSQGTEEYQLLLWLPTQDLARAFDGKTPVSDYKGMRYARIEFESPLPENTPEGEKSNISTYTQALFLE